MSKSIKRNKTKIKTRKKSKKNKQRIESRKYIELLNTALRHINSNISADLFDKDDYHLANYIKQGSKKGYELLKNENFIKDLSCNSLCLTMAILNSSIAKYTYDKLTILNKIFLFFLIYLNNDKNMIRKKRDIKTGLIHYDTKINNAEKQYLIYKERNGDDHRLTKKTFKRFERLIKEKEELRNTGKISGSSTDILRIDVCDSIDCKYLNEYKMTKGEKFNKSYNNFCDNIIEIYKGISWMNIMKIFHKNVLVSQSEMKLNINLRKMMPKVKFLLLPTEQYKNPLLYDNNKKDKKLRDNIDKGKYWVYGDLNLQKKTIRKIPVDALENKHYVVAVSWFEPNRRKGLDFFYNDFKNQLDDFVEGRRLPTLTYLRKSKRKNGQVSFDEDIENTITIHWFYIHKKLINNEIRVNINNNIP
jgi:hypothetical protein